MYVPFSILFVLTNLALHLFLGNQTGMGFSKSLELKQRSIVWDRASLQCLSDTGSAAFYPRMIALQDGALLLAYASGGNVVLRKKSAGNDWSKPKIVAAQANGINRDTPELLALKNGTILLCYGSRPQGAMRGRPQAGKQFDIRTQISLDGGATWGFEKVLYTADSAANNGCWEPAAVQLPSGEIQLFFANEAPYTQSNEQNISLLRSVDNGKNWSATPQIISFRSGSRDGMPVPVWNSKTAQVVVAIEDPGNENFKPYLLFSPTGGQWKTPIAATDAARQPALAIALPDSVYAGAPYLRQLYSGETILSYQSTEGRRVNEDGAARMVVAVGDANFRNFAQRSFPFAVPDNANALWNSLCVLKDDTLIALTSTTAFSPGRSQIWMIKGHLDRK